MKEKNLTGNYFWAKRWFGGFNLWVEIKIPSTLYLSSDTKYVRGNSADLHRLKIKIHESLS